jgi:hypothetical protein
MVRKSVYNMSAQASLIHNEHRDSGNLGDIVNMYAPKFERYYEIYKDLRIWKAC